MSMLIKKIIGILLRIGLTGLFLTGCGMPQGAPQKDERPVIKLGSDRYPPFNYFNEDGVPTGIDVDLATEAFGRMGYRVEVHKHRLGEKERPFEEWRSGLRHGLLFHGRTSG